MASDIWLRTILIVRKETHCHHIGYSYRLTTRVLLYAPSHRQDNTYHGLGYTSRGTLAGTKRNKQENNQQTLTASKPSASLPPILCRARTVVSRMSPRPLVGSSRIMFLSLKSTHTTYTLLWGTRSMSSWQCRRKLAVGVRPVDAPSCNTLWVRLSCLVALSEWKLMVHTPRVRVVGWIFSRISVLPYNQRSRWSIVHLQAFKNVQTWKY